MKEFESIIYVTRDKNSDDDENNLLAWPTLELAETGKVAVYELMEVLDKREVTEIRKPGTKTWFKPG